MAIALRQSTASQEVPLGFFLDPADGDTEMTGLTIANTDIKIWKTGATTLANKNSGGATHISDGVYYCVLDATDTNTIGPLVIFIHVATALVVRVECVVLDEAVYDVMFGTTAPSTITTANLDSALDSWDTETIPEPSGAPTWPMTRDVALAWIAALGLNPIIQTTSDQTLRDYADTTDVAVALTAIVPGVSATREEWS